MFVKISSLVLCLVLIQTACNVVAEESLEHRNRRETEIKGRLDAGPSSTREFDLGSKLEIECSLLDINGAIWWTKDGRNCSGSQETDRRASLTIDRAKIEDSGDYTCHATTNNGNSFNKTIRVNVTVRKIPEIRDFEAKYIGIENVNLTWRLIDDSAQEIDYNITVKKNTDGNVVFSKHIKTSNCNYDLNSTMLKKGETYKFEITAWNSKGDSITVKSNPVTMWEIDPLSLSTIPMNFTTTATNQSIKISWQSENVKPISSYYYKIDVTSSVKPVHYNTTPTNATTYIIEQLQPNTTYQVKAQGCLGNKGTAKCSEWTSDHNVTTLVTNGSSSLHSAGGVNLVTLSTIVSILFLFKSDVRSVLSL